jgi:hypothetical protein
MFLNVFLIRITAFIYQIDMPIGAVFSTSPNILLPPLLHLNENEETDLTQNG